MGRIKYFLIVAFLGTLFLFSLFGLGAKFWQIEAFFPFLPKFNLDAVHAQEAVVVGIDGTSYVGSCSQGAQEGFVSVETEIPANYTGSQVAISVQDRQAAFASIDLCADDYCVVNVTPGSTLSFWVSFDCLGSAGYYKIEITSYGSAPNPPSQNKQYGESCTAHSECQDLHCDPYLKICCEPLVSCCRTDVDCGAGWYCCPQTYGCKLAVSCSTDQDCLCGYCVNGLCQSQPATPSPPPSPSPSSYCGDGACNSDESCTNCATDCGECPEPADYCGNTYCDEGEDCSSCPRDCGKCKIENGSACSQDNECVSGFCVHQVCRDQKLYCGDGICDGDTCEHCAQDCCGSKLKLVPANERIYLQAEEEYELNLDIQNAGLGRADNAGITAFVNKGNIVTLDRQEIKIGNIASQDNVSAKLHLAAQEIGKAQIILHLHGDNFASIAKRIWVEVEPVIDLALPPSIFLQPNQEERVGILIGNKGKQIAKVQEIILVSTNADIVQVKEGTTMEVKGQGEGIKPGDLFSTQSEDLLRSIAPAPLIVGQSAGEAELTVKLAYHFSERGKLKTQNLERKIPVKVGEARGGKLVAHEFNLIPATALLEEGEARVIEAVLKNQGSEIIKQAFVRITPSEGAPFEATSEINFGYLEPGQQAKASFDLIATDTLVTYGDPSVNGQLAFQGEYESADGRKFTFEEAMQVTLVKEREVCDPGNFECIEATRCLLELSNATSCTLEFADIFPYLDKPVAAVLAASDVCEIAKRQAGGDDIGAALNQIFFTLDVADNLADAAPGAGNLFGGFVDVVEGAAQCAEGFVYDGVDQYCAQERHTGYRGCAAQLFNLFAQEADQYRDRPNAPRRYVVALVGSPVYVRIVDNPGRELTARDGVVMLQRSDLKFLVIRDPEVLENGYNFELYGYADGEYNITLAVIDQGEVQDQVTLANQSIKQDQSKKIPFLAAQGGRQGLLNKIVIGQDAVLNYKFYFLWRSLGKLFFQDKPYLLLIFFCLATILLLALSIRRRIQRKQGHLLLTKKISKQAPLGKKSKK